MKNMNKNEIPQFSSLKEEKEYWATYGSAMFRLSYLEHKIALAEANPIEVAESIKLGQHIPSEVYDDYRAGRRRNHAVNLAMLDWLAEGIFDYLLLPQDDTADYGWNIAEARTLQAAIRTRGLSERAITYPGADEIGCLLLASAVSHRAGFKLRVFPRYSSVSSPMVVTAYEDRPIHELLKAHLSPLGGTIATSPENADLVLFLNAPSHSQGEASLQWLAWKGLETLLTELPQELHPYLQQIDSDPVFQNTRREMESPQRSPEEFVRAMLSELTTGRPVALADVAFVNGADLILGNLLMQHPQSAQLCAYGGWNTAGNTLGTVLAHAVLRILSQAAGYDLEQTVAHLEFLFLRFLDDYYYQARERSLSLIEDLPAVGLQPTQERLSSPQAETVEKWVRYRLERAAGELEQVFINAGLAKRVSVDNIYLPWKRLFEIGFDVHVKID